MDKLSKNAKYKRYATIGSLVGIGAILFFAMSGGGDKEVKEQVKVNVIEKEKTLDESIRARFSDELMKLQKENADMKQVMSLLQRQQEILSETDEAARAELLKRFEQDISSSKDNASKELTKSMNSLLEQMKINEIKNNKALSEYERRRLLDNELMQKDTAAYLEKLQKDRGFTEEEARKEVENLKLEAAKLKLEKSSLDELEKQFKDSLSAQEKRTLSDYELMQKDVNGYIEMLKKEKGMTEAQAKQTINELKVKADRIEYEKVRRAQFNDLEKDTAAYLEKLKKEKNLTDEQAQQEIALLKKEIDKFNSDREKLTEFDKVQVDVSAYIQKLKEDGKSEEEAIKYIDELKKDVAKINEDNSKIQKFDLYNLDPNSYTSFLKTEEKIDDKNIISHISQLKEDVNKLKEDGKRPTDTKVIKEYITQEGETKYITQEGEVKYVYSNKDSNEPKTLEESIRKILAEEEAKKGNGNINGNINDNTANLVPPAPNTDESYLDSYVEATPPVVTVMTGLISVGEPIGIVPIVDNSKTKQVLKKKDLIPAGSFVRAKLLSGVIAPTMGEGASDPVPTIIRITDFSTLPNFYKADLKNCFVIAESKGNLATESVSFRLKTLTCMRENGTLLERGIDGYVTGENGMEGLSGRVVSKQGALLARAFVGEFIGGLANAFAEQGQTQVITGAGIQTTFDPTKAAQTGALKGVSESFTRLGDFYMDLADNMVPVIEINAGRAVDLVFIKTISLDSEDDEHKAEMKEIKVKADNKK